MADQKQNKPDNLDAGQIALKCAEFFMSIGESCLEFYHKYNLQKQKKTKLIKKNLKQKAKIVERYPGEAEQLNEEMKKKLPKKPLTAYIIYFQQKKPNFVEKYPGLNLSDLTKLIAKQWKQIDDNRRKPYLAQAQQDRKRYETEMREFRLKYGAVVANNEDNQQQIPIIAQNQQVQIQQAINGQQLLKKQKQMYIEHEHDHDNIEQEKPDDSAEADIENENDNDNDNDNDNENANQNEGEQNGEGEVDIQGQGSDNADNEDSDQKEEDDD